MRDAVVNEAQGGLKHTELATLDHLHDITVLAICRDSYFIIGMPRHHRTGAFEPRPSVDKRSVLFLIERIAIFGEHHLPGPKMCRDGVDQDTVKIEYDTLQRHLA